MLPKMLYKWTFDVVPEEWCDKLYASNFTLFTHCKQFVWVFYTCMLFLKKLIIVDQKWDDQIHVI